MGLEESKDVRLAIISPNKDASTETFIKAHKEKLQGRIFYYYGQYYPHFLNGRNLIIKSFLSRNLHQIKGKLIKNNLSLSEEEVLKSFKKNNIQVVLAEYGFSAAKILPVCQKLNLPLIVHFHGYDAHNMEAINPYLEGYKKVFEYAHWVISVSNFMTEALMKLGCPPGKIVYNPYGPNEDFFQLQPDYQSHQFVSVGRFVDKKAPYALIMAFKDLLKQFPQARLVMIGDGYLLNTCKNLAKILELEKVIQFVGSLSHQEVQKHIERSFCFLQHSIVADNGDSEGSPVGIIEASAAGLPVISTRHAGIIESVLEDKTGFLVDELDVISMSNYMSQLYKDRELCQRMGEAGRRHIKENFSLDKHLNKINNLIYG